MITARLFVYTLVSVGGQHTEVSTFCAPCKSSSPIGCLLHSCIWTWIQLPANTHVRYTARIIHATQIITTPHFTRPSFSSYLSLFHCCERSRLFNWDHGAEGSSRR